MRINNVEFNASLEQILDELVSQLRMNNIPYIQKMKPTGNSIQICCPYHADGMERKPSAGLRKTDGKFHCFACGEVHELYEVISYCFGHTEDKLGTFGWKWLLKNFATVQVENRKPIELDISRGKKQTVKKKYVTEEELDGYRYIHPYMYERRLTDEVIELFDIGYDSDSDCITFPVRDVSGNTLFVARRSIKTKYFNYPQGIEKPLYGLCEYYQCEMIKGNPNKPTSVEYTEIVYPQEVIICESMLDALSFWTIHRPALALNGLGNELQFKQLRELPCRKLILCTDMDKAGMSARSNIRQNVKNKIITEYILPKGRKDANECTRDELKNLKEIF